MDADCRAQGSLACHIMSCHAGACRSGSSDCQFQLLLGAIPVRGGVLAPSMFAAGFRIQLPEREPGRGRGAGERDVMLIATEAIR